MMIINIIKFIIIPRLLVETTINAENIVKGNICLIKCKFETYNVYVLCIPGGLSLGNLRHVLNDEPNQR